MLFEIFKRLQEIGELLGEPISGKRDKRLDLIVKEAGWNYESTNK